MKSSKSPRLGGTYYAFLLVLLVLISLPMWETLVGLRLKGRMSLAIHSVVLGILVVPWIYLHRERRSGFWLAMVLPVLCMASEAIYWLYSSGTDGIATARCLVYLVFFAVATVAILKDVVTARRVSLNHVAGSLCAYILLGLLWTMIYVLLQIHVPGAFSFHASIDPSNYYELTQNLLYYSFVTFTTLGYGEVVPAHVATRSMAILEAVIGQIFLVVLVARLVSMQITLGEDS